METNNLFIFKGSPLSSIRLVNYLEERMGRTFTLFSNAEKALRHIDKNTKLVILDSSLEEKKANVLQNEIKKINHATEVILLSVAGSHSYDITVSDALFKRNTTLREVIASISKIVNYSTEMLIEKFGVNKLLAILLSHFAFIGIVYFVFVLIIICLSQIAIVIPTI
jgi:hypothetical protein